MNCSSKRQESGKKVERGKRRLHFAVHFKANCAVKIAADTRSGFVEADKAASLALMLGGG